MKINCKYFVRRLTLDQELVLDLHFVALFLNGRKWFSWKKQSRTTFSNRDDEYFALKGFVTNLKKTSMWTKSKQNERVFCLPSSEVSSWWTSSLKSPVPELKLAVSKLIWANLSWIVSNSDSLVSNSIDIFKRDCDSSYNVAWNGNCEHG